jgi:protein involved in polysaccharide export with SLBB domain/capsular polysaccharide biosynthesis protein/Mrp family chromosome partitioning ATPase
MKDNLRSGPTTGTGGGHEAKPGFSTNGHPRANSQTNQSRNNAADTAKSANYWVVLDLLAQRWHWMVLGGMLFAAGFFLLAWKYVQPKYTATAQLLRYQTPGTSDFFKNDTPMSPETFAGLIRSPDLLKRVGDQAMPRMAPDKLLRCIKVDTDTDSDLVKVMLAAGNPQQAVDLLNLYANEAVAFTRELQANQASQVATEYLRKQVGQMDQDISTLHREFRGLPISPQVTNKLAEVGGQLNSLSQNLASASRPTVLIGMQTERLNKALSELTELLAKYTEIHPLVKQKQSEIDTLREQISQASTNPGAMTAAALTAPAATTSAGTPFNPELDIIRTKLLSLEEGRVQLASRQREAELYAADPPGFVRVFAPATLKTVASNWRKPKIGIATMFGGLVGVGAAIFLVLLVELADSRLKSADDVERVTKLPVLAELGDLFEIDDDARAQWAFRAWTMLQGRLSPSANHGLVCGLTSSVHGEGRSTWINLLAEAASLTGFRVLTIATRPSPSQAAGLTEGQQAYEAPEHYPEPAPEPNPEAVAPSVLSMPGEVTRQLTSENSQPVVHIPLPGWVWNLERRREWGEALNHWRQIDNLVILVELPPASVPEAVLLGANLPNMLWLAESGAARAAETRQQLQTLRDARCNLVGAVLNRICAVPVKRWFPRWIGAIVIFTCLGLTASQAQERNVPSTLALAQPAAPATSPATVPSNVTPAAAEPSPSGTSATDEGVRPYPGAPTTAEPAVPTTQPQTNLSFSVVRPSQRAAWQQHLTLGPGDVLNFGLYGEPELVRLDVPIAPDGRVSYLEAQDIVATGLTIDELREKCDQQLAQFRRAPRTMITPVAFHSKKYYMLGKVMVKGVYSLDRPITVLEAIARAHGFENGLVDRNVVDLADFSHSFLARGGKRVPLSFEGLFQSGDLSQNVPIEPGDYVYIAPAELQEIYVLGEVRLPGTVTFAPNLTVIRAITQRGGYTEHAYQGKVVVVRGPLNHPETYAINTRAILKAQAPDFELRPKDIIYVSSRPFVKVEELTELAATAFLQSMIATWVDVRVVKPFAQ